MKTKKPEPTTAEKMRQQAADTNREVLAMGRRALEWTRRSR